MRSRSDFLFHFGVNDLDLDFDLDPSINALSSLVKVAGIPKYYSKTETRLFLHSPTPTLTVCK